MTGEAEQLDEIATIEEVAVIDPLAATEEGEETQEFDIVLAGSDEPTIAPVQKSTSDHILSRVMKKKEKLADENAALKLQLESKAQQPAAVETRPDEDDYDDRKSYLQADSEWTYRMQQSVTARQLNQQQNAGRIAAQSQQREAALTTYAENAAKLKVKDFNGAQDKAFEWSRSTR